jgi:hypothetical protein
MMRRTQGLVKPGAKKSMAARFPSSDSVGYGSTISVKDWMFSP